MVDKLDASRRPVYPVTAAEYDARLDEKNAALAERIKLMEAQEAEALKAHPPAPAPKAKAAK